MADKLNVLLKRVTISGTTDGYGLLGLDTLATQKLLPVYCAGRTQGVAMISTLLDGNHTGYHPFVRIIDYNGDPVKNTSVTVLCYCLEMGGVIPTLLLALSGAGVRHERQADSTKYTNRACTRNKFCRRRREVLRCNFFQKIDRSKSSLHSYVSKWVGRIRFGTSHISSGYKFYLLCKEQFTYTVDDWLRLDSRWIDGLAVKAA